MSITTLTVARLENWIHCIRLFKLYCFPSILRNAELRNKWLRASKKQNKDKTEWKLSESDKVSSIHVTSSAYETNIVPTLKKKTARRILIRQPLLIKSEF